MSFPGQQIADERTPLHRVERPHESTPNSTGNNSINKLCNSDAEVLSDDIKVAPLFHSGTIGILGSVAIAVNSLTGPAMLDLPATYQRSGLIPTTVAIIFVAILSALCSLHMANIISKVPGNSRFTKEIEFSEAFLHFWDQKAFVFTQCAFFACITCLNIASIVDTAQVVDSILSHHRFGAIALRMGPGAVEWVSWSMDSCSVQKIENGKCIPFDAKDTGVLLLTLGYLISAVVFLPMGLMNLKENSAWQIVGFVVLLVLSCQFVFTFANEGLDFSNILLWGKSWDKMLGVILFNFAVVLVVPAWLYEREQTVSVPAVIWGSSSMAAVLFILIGALGALAIPNVSENMLQTMMSGYFGLTTQMSSEVFAFFIVGLGIPLFSVLSRLNLTGSGLCSRFGGDVLSVFLPWSVAWLFYSGKATTELLSWGGVIFVSVVAFLAPLLLAFHVLFKSDGHGSVRVYGGCFETKRSQKIALLILLLVTVTSITLAIYGTFFF